MSKPSRNGQDPSKPPNHKNPIQAEGGELRAPRWIFLEARAGRINASELQILLLVAEQTYGWSRPFVRLTKSDWAELSGMTERGARKVRDRLLDGEDGRRYLVRHQDGRSYVYGLNPPQWWGGEITREEIRKKASPDENGGNGAEG